MRGTTRGWTIPGRLMQMMVDWRSDQISCPDVSAMTSRRNG